MTAENKKIVYFSLGAVVIGAVYFFVKSYFKDSKEIVVGNTKVSLGKPKEEPAVVAPTKSSFNPKGENFGVFEDIKYEPTPVTQLWSLK